VDRCGAGGVRTAEKAPIAAASDALTESPSKCRLSDPLIDGYRCRRRQTRAWIEEPGAEGDGSRITASPKRAVSDTVCNRLAVPQHDTDRPGFNRREDRDAKTSLDGHPPDWLQTAGSMTVCVAASGGRASRVCGSVEYAWDAGASHV